MPVFRHASCGSEWIYVNLGDTYWLNHNHRKLWIANQIKSAQAIVLNASISGVIDMTTTNTPNDNNTRQNTACIENCWINTHPPFRKPYRKNTQINQQWHLQLCWKFHLIEPKLFGPILLSKRRILPIPWPHLSLSLLLKKKRPTQPWFTFFSRIDMKHPVAKRELKLQHWNVQARLRLKPYTQTWNSVHFPKQHINCMGRYAFKKSVQSVQKIVKQHGDAIPNMLLSMCSNHDFYQFISSKQHGDAWLKKVQKHLGFINKKVQNTMGRTSLA